MNTLEQLIEDIKDAGMSPYSRATWMQVEGWKQQVRAIERGN